MRKKRRGFGIPYSKRQHDIDMRNRRVSRAIYKHMPQRTDEFARALLEHVEIDHIGNHKLYVWCENGAWHAKAIRKSDGQLIKVMDVVLINVFALLCQQLGIVNEVNKEDEDD
jgi:hypothetical protein